MKRFNQVGKLQFGIIVITVMTLTFSALIFGTRSHAQVDPNAPATKYLQLQLNTVVVGQATAQSQGNITATPTGTLTPVATATPINAIVLTLPTPNTTTVINEANSVLTGAVAATPSPIAWAIYPGNGAAVGTKSVGGVNDLNVGFANIPFTAQPFVATGAGTPVTLGLNSLANYAMQVNIGTGITNLTAQLLGSYDGVNFPITILAFNSITATTANTALLNCGVSVIKPQISAWTLSGTPTVTVYPVAR